MCSDLRTRTMGGSSMLCLIFNENTDAFFSHCVHTVFTLRSWRGGPRRLSEAAIDSTSCVCRRAHPASGSPTRRNSLFVSHQPNAELPGRDERAVRGFELPAVAFAATESRGHLEGVRRRRGSLESVPRRGEPKAQSCDGTCCGRGAGHSRSGSPIRLQTGRA